MIFHLFLGRGPPEQGDSRLKLSPPPPPPTTATTTTPGLQEPLNYRMMPPPWLVLQGTENSVLIFADLCRIL